MRNILDKCPKKYSAGLASELRDMFHASTMEEARRLEQSIYDEYIDVAGEAMSVLEEGFEDSITIMALPSKYRIALRTSNIIERENREIRRREKVIQVFPNTDSIIRLMGALLMDDHNGWSTSQRLFDMKEYFDKQGIIQSKLQRSNVA
jgi:transposase-like protein